MERLFFKNAGLYFMVDADNENLKEALTFLQHEGFGTDRTVGNGLFELEEGSIEIRVPNNSDLSTNLSLYTPSTKDDFLKFTEHSDVAFDTLKRGGWITTQGYIGKEKKSVRMFAEGGIWNHTLQIDGKSNINLKPSSINSHPIWRSGRSLFIPIKTA